MSWAEFIQALEAISYFTVAMILIVLFLAFFIEGLLWVSSGWFYSRVATLKNNLKWMLLRK